MRQDLEVKLHQSGTKQAARHLAERKFRRRRKYPETSKTFIVLVIMPLHFEPNMLDHTSGCSPGFGFDLERRTIAIACAVCNLPSRHAISSTVFLCDLVSPATTTPAELCHGPPYGKSRRFRSKSFAILITCYGDSLTNSALCPQNAPWFLPLQARRTLKYCWSSICSRARGLALVPQQQFRSPDLRSKGQM